MSDTSNKYFFVDIETTGLDPKKDRILEMAIVVTDNELKEIDSLSLLMCPYKVEIPYDLMNKYVTEMHQKSGLLYDLERALKLIRLDENPFGTEKDFITFMDKHLASGEEKPPMCGSSVHFDRSFLKYHMPELEALFSYRNIDASNMIYFTELANGKAIEKTHNTKHRAYDDCLDSIDLINRGLKALRSYSDAEYPDPEVATVEQIKENK